MPGALWSKGADDTATRLLYDKNSDVYFMVYRHCCSLSKCRICNMSLGFVALLSRA